MINMKPTVIKYSGRIVFLIPILLFFFTSNTYCQKKYTLNYLPAGKDTSYKLQQLALTTSFEGKELAVTYISTLPAILLGKGFPTASVDSVRYDSTSASVDVYLGEQYKWAQISTDSVDSK